MTFQHYDLALAEAAEFERFWQDPEEFEDYEHVPTNVPEGQEAMLLDLDFQPISNLTTR